MKPLNDQHLRRLHGDAGIFAHVVFEVVLLELNRPPRPKRREVVKEHVEVVGCRRIVVDRRPLRERESGVVAVIHVQHEIPRLTRKALYNFFGDGGFARARRAGNSNHIHGGAPLPLFRISHYSAVFYRMQALLLCLSRGRQRIFKPPSRPDKVGPGQHDGSADGVFPVPLPQPVNSLLKPRNPHFPLLASLHVKLN
ncbi:hypothetical protein SDC9_88988 [bioreactor metagenome]|uniref:Uncharacterized protein n=1 Tax=bioreactor metagenome TaxID=1076179 RepID=A0A644ZUJ2_9ZZZZ